MRPVMVTDKAPVYPYVCIICGRQNGVEFFVDLGFDIAVLFQPLYEGAVYLCSDHMESLIDQYNAKVTQFRNNNRPVGTYSIRDKYITEQLALEVENDGTTTGISNEIVGESGEVDRPSESDESTVGGEDEFDGGSTGDDESDSSGEISAPRLVLDLA